MCRIGHRFPAILVRTRRTTQVREKKRDELWDRMISRRTYTYDLASGQASSSIKSVHPPTSAESVEPWNTSSERGQRLPGDTTELLKLPTLSFRLTTLKQETPIWATSVESKDRVRDRFSTVSLRYSLNSRSTIQRWLSEKKAKVSAEIS